MHRVVCAAVLFLWSTASAAGPAPAAPVGAPAAPQAAQALRPEERAEVRELLELTHATDVGRMMGKFVVDQMSSSLKSARPDLPPRAFDLLAEEVNATITAELKAEGGLEDLLVALYRKHFTREEIQALIAFYKTPVGKKLSDKLPVLGQEGMEAGARWGERIGPKIGERVQRRLEQEGMQL